MHEGLTPAAGRIALAAMAKVPVRGEVKTRLCPPLTLAQAAKLGRCLVADRVEQLGAVPRADRLVAFWPPEREPEARALVPAGLRLVSQHGADLGARMGRLLSDLLAEGYAGAIVVGTDTPTLPTAYLEEACAQLRSGAADVTVGPAEDGGYYLIGLRVTAPELFTDMPWGGGTVYAETLARARARGRRVAVLPSWFDVDRPADLMRLTGEPEPNAYRPRRTLAFLARLRV
jgi:rSAM/selenodomain-associated transferase 1